MWKFWEKGNNPILAKRSIPEIKQIARVLVIDDREPPLLKDLEKEGWRVRYLEDLDRYENTDLVDSQIICLDINGVGQILRCHDGMGLVEGIKEKYPQKRILLYSSMRKHDIFDSAIDSVDARVYKDGQPYQFIRAVEQLGLEAFDWQHCVAAIYDRHKTLLEKEMSLQEFEKNFAKCVGRDGEIDVDKIAKLTLVGLEVASKMAQLVAYVVVK